MANDGYLKLFGIAEGDDKIDIVTFHIDKYPRPGSGETEAGDKRFEIFKLVDRYSPILYYKAVDGTSIVTGSFTWAVEKRFGFAYRFGGLWVSGYQFGGPETESVVFSYDTVTIDYAH